MILNSVVGGHYPAQPPNSSEYCKMNDEVECYDSQKLIIDYVAYYQKARVAFSSINTVAFAETNNVSIVIHGGAAGLQAWLKRILMVLKKL